MDSTNPKTSNPAWLRFFSGQVRNFGLESEASHSLVKVWIKGSARFCCLNRGSKMGLIQMGLEEVFFCLGGGGGVSARAVKVLCISRGL